MNYHLLHELQVNFLGMSYKLLFMRRVGIVMLTVFIFFNIQAIDFCGLLLTKSRIPI